MAPRKKHARAGDSHSTDLGSAFVAAVEWMLDVKIPTKSAASIKADVAAGVDDPEEKRGCEAMIELHRTALRRDAPARDALREKLQPAFVASIRTSDLQSSPGLKAALDLYDAANAPIAAGPPPLTHEIALCYFNLLAFYQALVSDEQWKPLPEMARSDYTLKLAALYPEMPSPSKQWLANLPAFWTGLYAEWAGLAPDQRAARRESLIRDLSGLKTWPMADLPMHAGHFNPSRLIGLQRTNDAYQDLIGVMRYQGAAISKMIATGL